eukprot:scaffold236120_cov27-Tisochrysis_lutea.AAC.2
MVKRKTQRRSTLTSSRTEAMIDSTRMGMPGTCLRMRSGRSARAVRMSDMLPSDGKKMGIQPSVTTNASSWHHASRRYECWLEIIPYASTLVHISTVNMARKTDSEEASSSDFHPVHGSIGDSHAIARAFAAIASRMIGSNGGDSTVAMASRRGSVYGRRQRRAAPS